MKVWMLQWIGLGLLMCASLGLSARGLPAEDKRAERNDGLSVTVAFGAGLNTLPIVEPMAPNNQILPPEIKVRQGGVVHFLMSGFHMATVYNPGTEPENIGVPPSGTFINDPTAVPPSNVFYFGINPQGGPLNTPATTNPFNGSNRQESVSFPEPGTYLVICNVRQHFLDGMFALVKVVPPGEKLTDDR
jgi:plastocyanin